MGSVRPLRRGNAIYMLACCIGAWAAVQGGNGLRADSVYWSVDASDAWATPADWSSALLPGPASDVTIGQADPIVVSLDSGTQAIASLTLVAPDTLAVTNGSVAIANTALVGGTVTLSGAGSLTAAILNVGSGGAGAVTQSNGFVSAGSLLVTGTASSYGLSGGALAVGSMALQDGGSFGWTGGRLFVSGDAGLTIGASTLGTDPMLLTGQTLSVVRTLTLGAATSVTVNGGALYATALDMSSAGTSHFYQYGGVVSVETLQVGGSGSSYTLSGGQLQAGGLQFQNGAVFNWTSGQVVINGAQGLTLTPDTGLTSPLTPGENLLVYYTLTLPAGAGMAVDGGDLYAGTLSIGSAGTSNFTETGGAVSLGNLQISGSGSSYALAGGVLQTGSIELSNGGTLLWSMGGLFINGTQGLTISATTLGTDPTLVAGQTLYLVSTLSLPGGTRLTLNGGSLTSGTIALAGGTLQVGTGGTGGGLGTGTIINNGNVVFNVSGAIGVSNPISGAGTVTQMGAGTTTLTMPAAYTGPTVVSAGTLVYSGSVSHTVGSISGAGTLVVDAGATLTSDGVNLLNGTWIVNGSHVIRSSGGGGAYAMYAAGNGVALLSGTSEVSNLTFGAGANLDIRNNALIIEATSGTKAALLASIAGDIGAGAITSSTAASNAAYGLEVVDNAALGATHFGGLTVDSNSIIVTQALLGDANLDGVVNPSDLLIWANNFNNTGVYAVTGGDFNLDGVVNPTDLLIWANHFNNSIVGSGVPSIAGGGGLGSGVGGGGIVATPEPASLVPLMLGVGGLFLRRKRQVAG